jgi:hypothetical protein
MTYFNLYSVKFDDLKMDNETGHYKSVITYDGDLHTPGMKIVDVSETERTIEVEFLSRYPDFYDLVYSLDNYTVDSIVTNGERWFGNKPSNDTIDHLLQRTTKNPKSLHNLPSMIITVPKTCQIFGKENKHKSNKKSIKQNSQPTHTLNDDLKSFTGNSLMLLNDLSINSEISLDLVLKSVIFKPTKCYLEYEAKRIIVTTLIGTVTESVMDSTEEYSDETEAIYAMTTSEASSDGSSISVDYDN